MWQAVPVLLVVARLGSSATGGLLWFVYFIALFFKMPVGWSLPGFLLSHSPEYNALKRQDFATKNTL